MKKNTQKLPKIKKEIKDFLLSEEGKITKKDIAKIGLSLVVLAAMFPPEAGAQADHRSFLNNPGGTGQHSSHASHASHGSHGSHGSHCNGIHTSGW